MNYKYAYKHSCGEIAFYLSKKVTSEDDLKAEYVSYADGFKPLRDDVVECGYCRKALYSFNPDNVTPILSCTLKDGEFMGGERK